jgi:hypothetical protein
MSWLDSFLSLQLMRVPKDFKCIFLIFESLSRRNHLCFRLLEHVINTFKECVYYLPVIVLDVVYIDLSRAFEIILWYPCGIKEQIWLEMIAMQICMCINYHIKEYSFIDFLYQVAPAVIDSHFMYNNFIILYFKYLYYL